MSPVPFHLIDHPLAHDALAELRDSRTPPPAFRAAARRISLLLAAEAMRDMPTEVETISTPLGPADGRVVRADIVVVPVLRAGLGMLESILEMVPRARVGHIGLQRNEDTAAASQYYARMPPGLSGSVVLLADPMLATGGSAVTAIDIIKSAGAPAIRMMCIVAAPEGVATVAAAHPDVHIYSPALDSHLNARKFIVPGLGDFGDRLYGTL